MNFFDAQERSYRNTRWLILIMTLAVVAVVVSVTAVVTATIWLAGSTSTTTGFSSYFGWLQANPSLVFWTAVGTTAFIGFTSLFRIVSLRQGGGKVARDIGGTLVNPGDKDPLRRRLRNVVEEMAIASGVPTPEVYVLDHESGINAFAAGFSTDDAAVAVTRGTLETLDRDELQGVIAHEFSHVFNGDMRMNIQMMGPMFGILAIGMLGRILLRSSRTSGRSRGKGNGIAVVMGLGVGLSITGYVGLFLARLIKAGISRQREYLADASAVQFTRQTKGIAGALKKIAGYKEQSVLEDNDVEEVSHMLFASGFKSMGGMLATHPPLLNRIQAIEPAFTDEQMNQLHTELSQLDQESGSDARTAGFAGSAPAADTAAQANLIDTIGNPADGHYQVAQSFLAGIPAGIRDALESAYLVMLLVPALMLHRDPAARTKQLALLEQQLGAERRERVAELHAELQLISDEARLPLLNLALPLIKEQPAGRLAYLENLLEQMAMQDNQLELFEFALLRIYQSYIKRAQDPAAKRRWKRLSNPTMRAAAADLLTIFAMQSGNLEGKGAAILERLLFKLKIPTPSPIDGDWVPQADKALALLQNCTPRGRQQIVQAMIGIAMGDHQISRAESELLRAFCAIMESPLPPVLAAR